MRSLNLLFGKKVKLSALQIIWEVWFTASVVAFLITLLIGIFNTTPFIQGILQCLVIHVIASTLVGCITTEDKQVS